MEQPSRKRRRIIVIASSPSRTRVLVRKDQDTQWHLPNSHLHWPIGRRKAAPLTVAAQLIKDSTLGIAGELKNLKQVLSSYGHRSKLPTGGFTYSLYSNKDIDISQIVTYAIRARKHLGLKHESIELHDISEIIKNESHKKYGSCTIEAIRSLVEKSGMLPTILGPQE